MRQVREAVSREDVRPDPGGTRRIAPAIGLSADTASPWVAPIPDRAPRLGTARTRRNWRSSAIIVEPMSATANSADAVRNRERPTGNLPRAFRDIGRIGKDQIKGRRIQPLGPVPSWKRPVVHAKALGVGARDGERLFRLHRRQVPTRIGPMVERSEQQRARPVPKSSIDRRTSLPNHSDRRLDQRLAVGPRSHDAGADLQRRSSRNRALPVI